MKWPSLRPIQEEAIHAILKSNADVLISAATAAGKTEAAFLPILSEVHENPTPSVQAMYVGPLKALINDQFGRLEDLCQRAEIDVHRWHGDVDAGKKNRLMEKPSGVLLITPESIESLMINRNTRLPSVFRGLKYVVIDEIHALIGNVRGTHLRSLLFRLRRYVEHDFRIVGLSATLGNAFSDYAEWMRPDRDREVSLISAKDEGKQLLYKIHAYTISKPDAHTSCSADESYKSTGAMPQDMFRHFSGHKNLIFANRKSDVEWFADELNSQCRAKNLPEEFLVHHGSLSKEIREYTEQEMQKERPRTTVCSSTLELGIDIGNVRSVGQVDPPYSVNSLVQRLGRSGRKKGEPQRMRLYIREEDVDEQSELTDRLHLDLLQAIALSELLLSRPRWVEPPRLVSWDLSTLTQQILSTLAETGGCQAGVIFERLCRRGGFRSMPPNVFSELLRGLGKRQIIEQMSQGDLILAPDGEKVVGHYSFYSAFQAPIEFNVIAGSETIGRLPVESLPQVNDHLLLAGRRWQVVAIDDEQKVILVRSSPGKAPPRFLPNGGDIHERVRQKMREVLLASSPVSYLDSTASRLLQNARNAAAFSDIAKGSIVALSPNKILWFTWTGTRTQRALMLIAEVLKLRPVDHHVALELACSQTEATEKFSAYAKSTPNAIQLAEELPFKHINKFDYLVDDTLLVQGLARDYLDLDGALWLIETIS
ncbi:DEAD/DEAH box helicase [Bremerella cremea]|uniref:DEAD/DEAH box helicase n=1 Tax=Bremerella cremea TaxID=1031537 RepID=A0A368KYX3_9BACT|nr:DEAD/DEAH box helicase [Bremerella cremea]RCS54884.1 DEAD/DEAH box helicase [Bremerella cremea]